MMFYLCGVTAILSGANHFEPQLFARKKLEELHIASYMDIHGKLKFPLPHRVMLAGLSAPP
jgi:hypothetical protein